MLFFVAIGSIIWFFLFSYFLVRNRKKLRVDIISNVIHGLGMFLCGFALFLVWRSLTCSSRTDHRQRGLLVKQAGFFADYARSLKDPAAEEIIDLLLFRPLGYLFAKISFRFQSHPTR